MTQISVIVPTWKRVDHLKLVLNSLAKQTRLPDEVICGVRVEDSETQAFLTNSGHWPWPLKAANVCKPGVIHSMQAGVDASSGDIVCLFDDDAEPLNDWLELAENAFEEMDDLGIIGGRDLLQDHPSMRRQEPTTIKVGVITAYGRIYGNHHRGHGPARDVDILKGCNLATRGNLIRKLGFEHRLRGKGAQVHWEMALCFDIKNAGYRIVYDPALQVIHHIAPRHDSDSIHRGHFNKEGFSDMSFNESLVKASRNVPRQARIEFWNLLVGSSICPGFVRWLVSREISYSEYRRRRAILLNSQIDAKSYRAV